MKNYVHSLLGKNLDLPIGKVVCVGRNYLAHIQELGNQVEHTPLLFMKPSSAIVPLEEPIRIPTDTPCHHEVEIAILISKKLSRKSREEVEMGIGGYGLALDLTLREVQNNLKAKGHPWELAKAFDGSCPLSYFIPKDSFPHPDKISFALEVNKETRQRGNSQLMMTGILDLLAFISQKFTLNPGDVVLTGTPSGVAPLKVGDKLVLTLGSQYRFISSIIPF